MQLSSLVKNMKCQHLLLHVHVKTTGSQLEVLSAKNRKVFLYSKLHGLNAFARGLPTTEKTLPLHTDRHKNCNNLVHTITLYWKLSLHSAQLFERFDTGKPDYITLLNVESKDKF